MSIYLMTVGELAKKRGEPVAEFIKKINELGFEAGSHAKKLTQEDLDKIILLLDPNKPKPKKETKEKTVVNVENPNVLLINNSSGKKTVLFVNASLDSNGEVSIQVIEKSVEDSVGEALLEFRKQLGMKMGIN
jgi:hypothetical protein